MGVVLKRFVFVAVFAFVAAGCRHAPKTVVVPRRTEKSPVEIRGSLKASLSCELCVVHVKSVGNTFRIVQERGIKSADGVEVFGEFRLGDWRLNCMREQGEFKVIVNDRYPLKLLDEDQKLLETYAADLIKPNPGLFDLLSGFFKSLTVPVIMGSRVPWYAPQALSINEPELQTSMAASIRSFLGGDEMSLEATVVPFGKYEGTVRLRDPGRKVFYKVIQEILSGNPERVDLKEVVANYKYLESPFSLIEELEKWKWNFEIQFRTGGE
ncbi:MAG: hypothetical protein V1809_08215 [Planctomycetota bacterium]